jgi:hypothetical protein
MEIYYPYTTLEEKQGILDANTDKTLLRQEGLGNKRFLVFDDGIDPPFTIPDEVVKQAFIVLLGYHNDGTMGKTPAQFLTDIKARLGT